MTIKFEDTNPSLLYFGSSCRENNHHDSKGRNVRYRQGGACLACDRNMLPGRYRHEFNEVTETKRIKLTPEESRRKQIEHSTNWTKNHKDKHREYVKKYNDKDERKKYVREQHKIWYDSLTAEEKTIIFDRNRKARKAREERDPAYKEQLRLKTRARARIKYANMTAEEKEAMREKTKEYYKNRAITKGIKPRKSKMTDEERKQKQQDRYQRNKSIPGKKEEAARKHKEWWDNMPPEEKKVRLEKMKAYYRKKKEAKNDKPE